MAEGGSAAAALPRRGGAYVPPHKLREMQAAIADKSSESSQRLAWEALKKGINGIVNKVNTANIVDLIPELFHYNLVRGRGVFCRSIMKAQMTSPGFTPIYAALAAVVNTKLPELGELLVKRVVSHFRRAYKRNNKLVAVALVKFIAHLVNQQVAHEIVALQLLALLLERVTDDSVEIAASFTREAGQMLTELTPAGMNTVFERFRAILHEGDIDARVQYMIEELFAVRKGRFKDYPAIPEQLDLVEAEDQITHEIGLDDTIDAEETLDVFKLDADFLTNERLWEDIRKEILGDDEEGADGAGAGGGAGGAGAGAGSGAAMDYGDGEHSDHEGAAVVDSAEVAAASSGGGGGAGPGAGAGAGASAGAGAGGSTEIVDLSETDLINLRRTIYLTIMSSMDFEECAHKLRKMNIPRGAEGELATMIIECCSQEKTFLRYFGLLGQRFCMISQVYQDKFEEAFAYQYANIHRLETNKLRNVAKLFAHLLQTDALPWTVFQHIRLTEDDTNPSSRIFIKILVQELTEYMGLAKVRERLCDSSMADVFGGLFPRDALRHTRFAINFFTSIGLGALTDDLRVFLKKKTAEQAASGGAGAGQ